MESNNEYIAEEDIEEEEVLLYSEFDSVLNDEIFQQNAGIRIIGLDSDEPFLQIGSQMYCGKWADSVGTHLFFESEASLPPSDPIFSDIPSNILNFKYKTRKCLELSRVFINQKENPDFDDSVNIQSVSSKEEAINIQETEISQGNRETDCADE